MFGGALCFLEHCRAHIQHLRRVFSGFFCLPIQSPQVHQTREAFAARKGDFSTTLIKKTKI